MENYPAFHVHLYGADCGPLTSRFDEVAERLRALPRLHFEPDGSLLWSGQRWQVGGMIYDREGTLQYADLQGRCPRERWQLLVRQIAGPTPRLSVLRLSDHALHDLQTFEKSTWPSE